MPILHAETPLVLASASPRRRDLLQSLGLRFEVHPPLAPELKYEPGTVPEEYAILAAKAKACEAAGYHPGDAVLSADTIVIIDGTVLGKPRDGAEALAMLSRLAGREHQVVTGCCLLCVPTEGGDVREECFAVKTRVWMADFGPKALLSYIDTGDPLDKAGAYGVQEQAAFLVKRIDGSYTNVVGLPLSETVALLLRKGIVRVERRSGPRQPVTR